MALSPLSTLAEQGIDRAAAVTARVFSLRIGSFALWTSLGFTVLFYLPYIFYHMGRYAKFLFYGDTFNLWMPQLFNTWLFTKGLTFYGLDFFTHGGSSEFFLRPNLLTHYPPMLLLSQLVDLTELKTLFRFICFTFVGHSFLCCYFTQRLCREFLGFGRWMALFIAVSFAFSYQFYMLAGLLPFFFIVCLVPVCMYGALAMTRGFTIPRVVLASLPMFLALTAGYAPMALATLFVAALFALVYCHYLQPAASPKDNWRRVIRASTPFLLAGVVALPFYLAIMDFNELTTPFSLSVYEAAHRLGLNPNMLMRLAFHEAFFGTGEQENLIWGLIPILLMIAFFAAYRKTAPLPAPAFRLLGTCLLFYFPTFFAIFGIYSAMSEMFYYLLPGIGSMHLYQRFLFVVVLFLYIALAIMVEYLTRAETAPRVFKWLAAGLCAALFYIWYMRHVGTDLGFFSRGHIVFQVLVALILMLCFVLFSRPRTLILLTMGLTFMVSVDPFYQFGTSQAFDKHVKKAKGILGNPGAEGALLAHYDRHSNKAIVKQVNLLPDFGFGYILKNYPWMAREKRKISDYYGYEQHLAAPVKYREKMRYTHVPPEENPEPGAPMRMHPDWDWLAKTGAEFAVLRRKELEMYRAHLDMSDPAAVLELPEETLVVPLAARGAAEAGTDVRFDNGYLRAHSDDPAMKVTNFFTDDATLIRFTTASQSPVRAAYLFWPNARLIPFIDGKRAHFTREDGLDILDIPAGTHSVIWRYENLKMQAFMVVYVLYGVLVALAGLYWLGGMIRRRSQ